MPPPPNAPPHGQFQEQMQHQEALMLTRRQKTLSSISNYVPLHVKLNLPKGIEFNVTVPRSFTIEQLARQIEAEYAYMVEREIGHSSYPVIQCGALFDHIGDRSSHPRSASVRKTTSLEPNNARTSGTSNPPECVQCSPTPECDATNSDGNEEERDEADTRGVQLRFADKVGEVLDRYSTVHVVNIDQGVGLGRKLSLSNLTLAVNEGYITRISENGLDTRESMTTLCHDPSNSDIPEASSVETEVPVPDEDSSNNSTYEKAYHESEDNLLSSAPQDNTSLSVQDIEETTFEGEATTMNFPQENSSEPSMETRTETSAESKTTKIEGETTTEVCDFQDDTQNTATKISRRPQHCSRSRATDILLNLEASSNDARFQEILHNTIALDHFRQFCFQEYSIENLLFWMDVELFAKPSQETLSMGASKDRNKEEDTESSGSDNAEPGSAGCSRTRNEGDRFAIQHARYIYLTYIDTNGPLQVNLSDESRSEISWPILDRDSANDTNHCSRRRSFSTISTPCPSSPQSVVSYTTESQHEGKDNHEDQVGWPLDRHMFDGAQEHTYQLMKGHTLVRFEESDLWRNVQKIMREQPEEYAKATIAGTLNSYYKPDPTVIISAVARSRTYYPAAKPDALYNWNNSTSDLDRSKDKEEALAMTMSQYFGPIPAELLHPSRSVFGSDHHEYTDDVEDEYEDELDAVLVRSDSGRAGRSFGGASKRSSTATIGATYAAFVSPGRRRSRFGKRLSGGIGRGSKRSSYISTASEILSMDDDTFLPHHLRPNRLSLVENMDWVENERRRTRWMVAGYFNDQVRLTEAQRKRLLRRNIKLTKFFGSRVDGTLHPVEGANVDRFSNGNAGGAAGHGASAPPLPSLPFSLSPSVSHDLAAARDPLKTDRKAMKSRSVEPALWANLADFSLLPPSDDIDVLSKSKTTNFIQKLRRFSPESEDDGIRMLSMSSPCSPKQMRSHDSPIAAGVFASTSPFFKRYSGYSIGGHHRSATIATALDVRHPTGQLIAHPHPLWSGSPSDQEIKASPPNGRTRSHSLRSDGTAASNLGVPRETCHPLLSSGGSEQGSALEQGETRAASASAASIDELIPPQQDAPERHSMVSRRKKADKLSTFFGTKLTTQELSSQLTMDEDAVWTEGDPKLTKAKGKGDKDTAAQQPPLPNPVTGPSFSSVNRLSNKERTILWKRNKKLRGLLGESLPESEVATALTRPVLLCSSGQRRTSMSRPLRTACIELPLYEKNLLGTGTESLSKIGCNQIMADRREGPRDREQVSIKRPSAEGLTVQTTMWNAPIMKSKTPGGRVVKRGSNTTTMMTSRSRRTSAASISPGLRPRSARGSAVGPNRSLSINSSESLFDDWDGDDNSENVEASPSAWSPLEPKRRKQGNRRPSVLSLSSPSSPSPSPLADIFQVNECTALRLARKRKMDKIQQFLGDRIPTEELWIGAVGKESTQRMMDMNLLSSPEKPTSHEKSAVAGRLQPASSLVRATRSRLASSSYVSTPAGLNLSGNTAATIFRKRVPTNRGKAISTQTAGFPSFGDHARGVAMERSFSDPPVPTSRALSEDDGGIKPLSRQCSTVNRLRQKLAADSRSLGVDCGGASLDVEVLSLAAMSDSTSDSNDSCTPLTEVQSITSDPTGAERLNPSTDGVGFETEEYSEILPKLRSMTHQDQEKFFKRAEKLEKLFGSIPPSTLIESSLTTFPLVHQLRTGAKSKSDSGSQRQRQSLQAPPPPSRTDFGSEQKGLIELAGLWATGHTASEGSSSSDDERELVRRSFSEEIVESLAMAGIM